MRSVRPDGDGKRVRIDLPSGLTRYIIEKASVTVDGASLTVTEVDDAGFEVALIPHTLSVTTLGRVDEGSRVNVEVDVLAKYVEKLATAKRSGAAE